MEGSSVTPALAAVLAALAAGASAFGVELVRRRAGDLQLVDVPNERSSHTAPTPRGGGLGLLGGVFLALVACELVAPTLLSSDALSLVSLALFVGFVGLADDRGGVRADVRLALHLAAATILVLVVGPIPSLPLPEPVSYSLPHPWASVPFTVLWVAGLTSFFNFMDGVDGLAGGQAAVSAVAVALAGWSSAATVVAIAVAGAATGFLVHNWPPAKIFMGDVGSGAVGFLLAGLPLLAEPHRRGDAALAVGLSLTFFILDPLVTLARRAVERKPLLRAHREHLYQRLIPAGTRGTGTTTALLAGAGVLALAGVFSFRAPEWAWPTVGCAVAFFLIEWALAFRATTGQRWSDREVPAAERPPEET